MPWKGKSTLSWLSILKMVFNEGFDAPSGAGAWEQSLGSFPELLLYQFVQSLVGSGTLMYGTMAPWTLYRKGLRTRDPTVHMQAEVFLSPCALHLSITATLMLHT